MPAPQVSDYGLLMPLADINGVTIGYDSCGDDEPLLPVMGFGDQLTDWRGGLHGIEAHRT